jgi:2-polyprenyl-3-methyl-5-hydroxy-6-metoxy-1,4-benzoquinol methylase
MIEIHTCPACNGLTFNHFLICTDHAVSHEKFNIVKCSQCELLITTPRPGPTEIAPYYVSPAYTSHIKTATNTFDRLYLTVRTFTLKWKLSIVEKNAAPSSEKQILDFGCGTGEFIKVAKHNGWNTIGMEPSQHARQHVSPSISKDIKNSLQEVSNLKKKFDAITLWHVLEHVDELNTTIENLKNLLTENGRIYIAVPNSNSWDAHHYKQHWAAYDVPRHLWHFNIKSMHELLKQHQLTNIKVLPMWLDAFYVAMLSEKYRNGDSFSARGMLNSLFNAIRSNYAANRTREFSSLIYVVKK